MRRASVQLLLHLKLPGLQSGLRTQSEPMTDICRAPCQPSLAQAPHSIQQQSGAQVQQTSVAGVGHALVLEYPSRRRLPGAPGVPGWLLLLRWSLTRCRSMEKRALARFMADTVGRKRDCLCSQLQSTVAAPCAL